MVARWLRGERCGSVGHDSGERATRARRRGPLGQRCVRCGATRGRADSVGTAHGRGEIIGRDRLGRNLTGLLEQTPELQASFSPSYRRDISDDWQFNARADILYRSKYFIDYTNHAWIGARVLVNPFVGFTKKNFKLDFFVKNLFDNDTLNGGARTGDGVYAPNTTCTAAVPTCYNPALPPAFTPSVSVLNLIALGLPDKRTFGVRASMEF